MNVRSTYRLWAMAFAMAFFVVSCSKEGAEPMENTQDQLAAPSFSEVIPGQYIVVYRESGKLEGNPLDNRKAVQNKTKQLLSENNIKGAEIIISYSAAISGVALKMSENDAAKLRLNKEVAYVEQDRIIALGPPCGTPNGEPCPPTDPDDGGDTGDGSSTEETPYGITRVNGGVTYTGNKIAWVIDTGVDLYHPDLNVDASRGYNAFTSGRDGKSLDDGNGHGSHVAGTIAALDNDLGVIGVAAGATVVPVKVLDSRGSGSYSGVIAGVDHVAANGEAGDVANMSLGGPVSDALDKAVLAAAGKGIKFVLAAGNDSDDANNYSPAHVNHANVYTISAMDNTDTFAYFSNYANPPVDYCAPGVNIKSTWKDGGYNTISGTSMAAPHAAGVLLLGNPSSGGTVNDDPDVIEDPNANADPIIVR